MWPFSRAEPSNSDLVEKIGSLERKIKALELDWDAMYEKFQRLNARLAARARRLEELEDEDQEERPGPGKNGQDPAPASTNPLALELLRGMK